MGDDGPSARARERFEIRDKLGAGGMGVVYRAIDHDRHIEVALKTLLHGDPRALYRFKREFRALADVAHPNLVALYELHTAGDQWFFTMELVDGVSFVAHVRPGAGAPAGTTVTGDTLSIAAAAQAANRRERIVAGTLDPARLDAALYQLVDGVLALHRCGKLHRDLKPSNVLVDRNGRLVILDFGLTADTAHIDQDRTHEAMAVGTPMYMSPEQARNAELTEASDWYSVGVMLYEALTGRRPFEGDGGDPFIDKQDSEPPPPRALDPGVPAALDDLCARMLRLDPARRPTGEQILGALGRAPSDATEQLAAAAAQRPIFVGREQELAALHAGLADARAGRCIAVLVRGESGMGKTTLVRQFLGEVERMPRALVVQGRCYERESVPYKALDTVIDGLTRHLLGLTPAQLEDVLPRDILTLARLFPVLRRVPAIAESTARPVQPLDPHELRVRAFGAFRVLLERLGRARPVVMYIDDLQWGDADSAPFLINLIRHPTPPAILLVLGYRLEDEATSPLVAALRGDAGAGAVRELTVGPLPDGDARELARALGADDDAVVRESGGRPFFLSELARLRATAEDGATLDGLLQARVRALPPDERRLLVACAAIGRPVPRDVAVRAAGAAGEGPELAALRAERLLRSRVGPTGDYLIEPYHDRVRAAALSTLDLAELSALHRQIARAMEDTADRDPRALVDHWLAAGDHERAGRYAAEAARSAADTFAFAAAARYYALALEHLRLGDDERRAMQALQAHALASAGRLDEAAEAFGRAAEGAPRDQQLELQHLELEQLMRRGRLDEGMQRADRVLRAVGLSLPRSRAAAIVSLLAQRAALRLRGFGFQPRAEADIPPPVLRRADVCWSVASALTFTNPIAGRSLQMRYIRAALDSGERARVARALMLEAAYRSVAGTPARAMVEDVVARAQALADEVGEPRLAGEVEGAAGVCSFLSGHWREARARLERGEAQMRDYGSGSRWELDLVQIFRMATLTCLGELRELVRLAPIYVREAEERGDVYAARGLCAWRSNLTWLVMGRPDEARARIDDVAVGGGAFHLHHYYELASRAAIELYEGDGERAWRRVQDAARDVKRSLLLRLQTLAIEWPYLVGRAALATGRAREARHAARAIDQHDTPWGRPLAAVLRAGAAALAGDDAAAERELRAAADGFAAVDMAMHAAAARAKLGTDDGWMTSQGVADPPALVRLLSWA